MRTNRSKRSQGRRPRRRDEVEELLGRYAREGGTLKGLAAKAGIALSTVHYWRGRLSTKRGGTGASRESRRFMPVSVRGHVVAHDVVGIDLPNGRQVRVSESCDPEALSRLLEVIDRR